MEMRLRRNMAAVRRDRLTDLPEPLLIHILSMLGDGKEVVRTSVLSTRWRSLWKSVPVSLGYCFPITESREVTLDFIGSINRELYYRQSCEQILKFRVWRFRYEDRYAKNVDLWVHFAIKIGNVEDLTLSFVSVNDQVYEFPQFAYRNAFLNDLSLRGCKLNPSGRVNWSNLGALSLGFVEITDDAMQKVLSGSPNLECLELTKVSGLHRLEINSVKMKEVMFQDYYDEDHDVWLELIAPHIQHLGILGLCSEIRIAQKNVPSLFSAILSFKFDFEDEEGNLENEFTCLKGLLHSVAHVENLELGSWCIECVSILELRGWRAPPSSRKFLELNIAVDQLDFPGICSFLQSSLDLETLVIDWYDKKPRDLLSRFTTQEEQTRRFAAHSFNGTFPHLTTIKIDNLDGLLSENKYVLPLVKYLLKHATVLEEFVIAATILGSDMLPDYDEMEQELLSFPRSSQHASVVFCD